VRSSASAQYRRLKFGIRPFATTNDLDLLYRTLSTSFNRLLFSKIGRRVFSDLKLCVLKVNIIESSETAEGQYAQAEEHSNKLKQLLLKAKKDLAEAKKLVSTIVQAALLNYSYTLDVILPVR